MTGANTIFDINLSGEYLNISSNGFELVFIFLDHTELKLYKLITNMSWEITNILEVDTPEDFSNYTTIKFFKHTKTNNGDKAIEGIIVINETDAYRFKINDYDELVYTEAIGYQKLNTLIDTSVALTGIDIIEHTTKGDKTHLIGYDITNDVYIYAVLNVTEDKLEKVYMLYSDDGDIIPAGILMNKDDRLVYVVGRIEMLNEKDELTETKPYLEMFLGS